MKKVERLVPHEGHGWGAEMESSEGWVEGTPTYVSSEDYDALVEEYNKLALVAEKAEEYLHLTENDFGRDKNGKLFYNMIKKEAGPLYASLALLPPKES